MALLSLLADLFGPLLKWLVSRIFKTNPAKASNDQAEAEAHSGGIQTNTANRVEQARARNDQTIDKARTDAGGDDGLLEQSDDVSAAIAQADRELR